MTKSILWLAVALAVVYSLLGNSVVGLVCAVSSTINFMWGCGRYAMHKGYPALVGVLPGIFNVVGLVIVALLPDRGEPRQSRWSAALVTAIVFALVATPLLAMAGVSVMQVRRAKTCAINLSRIGTAMHNYHGKHGEFPPAFTTSEAGQPLHSWRILILPFLGAEENKLYSRIKLDEPWNTPENLRVAETIPDVYECPSSSQGKGETSYVVISGPGMLFDEAGSTPPEHFRDSRATTIMVVEVPSVAVTWTQPVDLNLSLMRTLDAPGAPISGVHDDYFLALMVNGEVKKLPAKLSGGEMRELADPNDGKPDTLPEVWPD